MSSSVRVELNSKALGNLLRSPEMERFVEGVADRVAAHAADIAGSHTVTSTVNGETVKEKVPVEMRRTSFESGEPLNDDTRSRARAAVLASHPTGTGREAGMRALVAALDAGGAP